MTATLAPSIPASTQLVAELFLLLAMITMLVLMTPVTSQRDVCTAARIAMTATLAPLTLATHTKLGASTSLLIATTATLAPTTTAMPPLEGVYTSPRLVTCA